MREANNIEYIFICINIPYFNDQSLTNNVYSTLVDIRGKGQACKEIDRLKVNVDMI